MKKRVILYKCFIDNVISRQNMKNVDSWFLFCRNNVSGGCHEKKYRVSKSLDVKLILILFAFCVISITAIYSSQQTGQYGDANFALKQGVNYIIGVVLLLLVASIDLDQLQKLSWPLYIAGFGSLILLKILPVSSFTPEKLGAKDGLFFLYLDKSNRLSFQNFIASHSSKYCSET